MVISNRFNEKLLSEKRIIDRAAHNRLLRLIMFLSQHQPGIRGINWAVTVIENIQLIYLYKDNPSPDEEYTGYEKIYAPRVTNSYTMLATLYFQIAVCSLLFIFFILQNYK